MPTVEMPDLVGEVAHLRGVVTELRARVQRLELAAAGPRALPDGTVKRAEAARLLGVSVPCMDRWARRGVGPAFRLVGGRARYRVSDIEAWAASCPRPANARKARDAAPLLTLLGA